MEKKKCQRPEESGVLSFIGSLEMSQSCTESITDDRRRMQDVHARVDIDNLMRSRRPLFLLFFIFFSFMAKAIGYF